MAVSNEDDRPARRRSRSPLSPRVLKKVISLSLSPAAPVTRSLSPIMAPFGRRITAVAAASPNSTESSGKNEPGTGEKDCGAVPAGLAKSFVSLLTTASMYSGNLEQLVEDPEEVGHDIEQDVSEESVYDLNQLPKHGKEGLPANRPALERNQTLFELSVQKKFDQDSHSKEESKHRAMVLCEKLVSTFSIKSDDVFVAEYPCWLLKDVLIQGHLYITQSHLLYFAYLPKKSKTKIAITGNLNVEYRTPRQYRYWAVLKDNTLSFYTRSTELYFPVLTVDLRYAFSAEVIQNRHILDDSNEAAQATWFKVLTEIKSYRFQADSEHSARKWVSLIKKHIFASRNQGDCVSIKIPLQNVLDCEKTEIFETSETLRLKVMEAADSYAIDDYFLMFFKKGPEAISSIDNAIKEWKNRAEESKDQVYDSTLRPEDYHPASSSTASIVAARATIPAKLGTSLVKKVLQRPRFNKISENYATMCTDLKEAVVEQYHSSSGSTENPGINDELLMRENDDSSASLLADLNEAKNSDGDDASLAKIKSNDSSPRHRGLSISRWTPKMIKSASSMWSSNPVHYEEEIALERGVDDDPFLASPNERVEATKRFRQHFSLSSTDLLVSAYYSYLQRNIPTYGKIYLGSNEICFRSLVPGLHTTMLLPYKDIENCYKEKGFKFGYSGLVLVIHGHEELFFEFSSDVARDDCEFLLLKQIDRITKEKNESNEESNTDESLSSSYKLEVAKIRLFEDKIHSTAGLDIPIMVEDNPFLKTSIKPKDPYRFTLLTIGSRGDVQPYIALGLGLIKEGHKVTIATHKEFKDWVLGYGIGFIEIAGNPTELMSLMVEHGSMNVGLIKEASKKFRGWIGELLETSWKACQDTDILIESPSAMAGIHIAEALNIPYFRAFTMPWTRTRAYPHAFIVPDQKRGGSYNYLTYVVFENIFWKGTAGQINKWRKETLGLPKTNLEILQQNKVPFLYNVSPTVYPPPVDYNDWIKVTGYWFLNESSNYEPPQELIEFLSRAKNENKKVVYIGFGSIVVSNPKELTEAIVNAVIEADVYCILNKGWSERLGGSKKIEVELPVTIYNSGSLPHDWLFPRIDAAVHHGGSGTTGASLRAGLPTIIKPFFGDQFFYANRVEDIGVGVALKKLNTKSFVKALKEVTTNQRMISKAKEVGEQIRKEDGVNNAILSIYTELEYAKSLIQEKRRAADSKRKEPNSALTTVQEIDDIDKADDLGEGGSWLLL